jgi:ankyrin repeat protein
MKQLLLTTIAAVVLVGCGESQQSTTPAETQPAETVAAATQPELPTDVSNRKLIKIFWFSYPYEPEPGYRMWERSDEGMWTENYPSGFKSMFEEVGRIKVDGLSGDYAVKVGGDSSKTQTVDGSFRVFIPDYSDTETFLYMSRKIGDDWGEWEKSNYLIKVMTTRDGLKHGTAHGAVVTRDVDGLRSLLNDGVNINAKDEDGKTPLDYANNEVAKILINHGAKTSDELKADERKLVDAARDGDIQKVKSYLAIGIDVNTIDEDGHTPLHWKVNNEVVKLLIAKGANVNAISKHGRTPLDFAIMRGQEEAVETLRKHGGKTGVELKAAQPDPPTAKAPAISIHDAATEGNIEAVRQHLAAGTDVNAKLGGRTSLHLAAYEGHKAIAALLISEGGNINAKSDVNGGTPLHAAAFGGRTEIVELLIANGADVNAKAVSGPKQGKTPLDAANETNHPEIADLLRKHGGKTGAELKAEGK